MSSTIVDGWDPFDFFDFTCLKYWEFVCGFDGEEDDVDEGIFGIFDKIFSVGDESTLSSIRWNSSLFIGWRLVFVFIFR